MNVNEAGQQDEREYVVVKSINNQYSIWPSDKLIPHGWRAVADPMVKDKCLKQINSVWADMHQ